MATYTGYMNADPMISEQSLGNLHGAVDNSFKRFYKWVVSTTKPYTGAYSLELYERGIFTIDVAVDIGSRTVTMKAWAPPQGSVTAFLVDPDDGSVIDTDTTASTGAWEDLSITWTAEAKVYLLLIRNNPQTSQVEGDDNHAYIDNVVVT